MPPFHIAEGRHSLLPSQLIPPKVHPPGVQASTSAAAPAPLRDIRLALPGLTGREKPVTLRGGQAELHETKQGYELVLNELVDYEAIILE